MKFRPELDFVRSINNQILLAVRRAYPGFTASEMGPIGPVAAHFTPRDLRKKIAGIKQTEGHRQAAVVRAVRSAQLNVPLEDLVFEKERLENDLTWNDRSSASLSSATSSLEGAERQASAPGRERSPSELLTQLIEDLVEDAHALEGSPSSEGAKHLIAAADKLSALIPASERSRASARSFSQRKILPILSAAATAIEDRVIENSGARYLDQQQLDRIDHVETRLLNLAVAQDDLKVLEKLAVEVVQVWNIELANEKAKPEAEKIFGLDAKDLLDVADLEEFEAYVEQIASAARTDFGVRSMDIRASRGDGGMGL